MATKINSTLPNTFTQEQWDKQSTQKGTDPLAQTSKQFQDQFRKTGADLQKLAQDNTDLQKAPSLDAYVSQISQYQKDFAQLHQDAIQLINTAKTEGSPYELGLANSVADEGRQLANSIPKAVGSLSAEQAATAADATNKILQAENDIQSAGTYTINGKDYNNSKLTLGDGSQYIDPHGQGN